MSRTENIRFDSWKEIAAYLQRDARTVRRWEQDRALPVHRVPGGGRAAVYAYSNEIDEWLQGRGKNGNGDISTDIDTKQDPGGTPRARDQRPMTTLATAALVLLGGLFLWLNVASLRNRLLVRTGESPISETPRVSSVSPDVSAGTNVATPHLDDKPTQASSDQPRIGKNTPGPEQPHSSRASQGLERRTKLDNETHAVPIIAEVCPRPLAGPLAGGKFYGTLVITGKNLEGGTITTSGPLSLIGDPTANSSGTSISTSYEIGCCAPQDKQPFKFFVRTASGSTSVEDKIALSVDPGAPCPIASHSIAH
jgi:hypothetical protein